ncbi:MAG: hypothetical protein LBH12_04215 [Dysgonamonadaceae bacterium]|nr:hypothetical protein [Dysgonamonadaceae bacterium]
MVTVILLSFILILFSILLLGVNVFFSKKRKFPNTHVSGNKTLREKGIHCAITQDREARNRKNLFDLIENN